VLSTNLTRSGFLSKGKEVEQTNEFHPHCDQELNSESTSSSLKSEFDDSGYHSDNGEDIFSDQCLVSKTPNTTASLSSAAYEIPQTPQKATKPVSSDSGISMSFDTFEEPYSKRPTQYNDLPESPLTEKALRANRVAAGSRSSRPAATPIQPGPLSIRPKRNFAPFNDHFTKMRHYITKPLKGDNDMKEGYIYGFQIEGCAYTKIGLAAKRRTEPTLEASFEARMKEHKRSDWPDLKIVLKKRVPHVHRVEKLIHFHLEAGRLKEQCSCIGSKGQELHHGKHTEWFNNSLDEIYSVVIAWEHWIWNMPYTNLDDGRKHLTPEWKSYVSYLENPRGFQNGRDNWLEWLCRHVPDLPGVTNKVPKDTIQWIEDEAPIEVPGAFVRNTATDIKVEIKRAQTTVL
jgi:T5orf172 domain